MPQTPPPEVDVLPDAPSSQNPIPFAGIMDTFLAALAPFRTGMIALTANCYNNAVDCYNNAQLALSSAISASASAAAASATAGVTKWVSGSSYIEGDDATWSPINYLTYRRKTTGAGILDPSVDATNWAPTSAAPGANHDITSLSGLTTPLSVDQGGTGADSVADARIALGIIPSGTRMIFQQTSAPTGWTKDVSPTMNNASIRLTTGTIGLGGTVPFSTFAAQTIGATTLTVNQIPSHNHVETMANGDTAWSQAGGGVSGSIANNSSGNGSVMLYTGSEGGGASHTHSLNMDLVYVDFIVATKD